LGEFQKTSERHRSIKDQSCIENLSGFAQKKELQMSNVRTGSVTLLGGSHADSLI
jgi:hypothetical protein